MTLFPTSVTVWNYLQAIIISTVLRLRQAVCRHRPADDPHLNEVYHRSTPTQTTNPPVTLHPQWVGCPQEFLPKFWQNALQIPKNQSPSANCTTQVQKNPTTESPAQNMTPTPPSSKPTTYSSRLSRRNLKDLHHSLSPSEDPSLSSDQEQPPSYTAVQKMNQV